MVRFGLEGLLVVPLAVTAGVARRVARLIAVSAELTPVSPGVVRVSWTAELQEQGLRVSADEVRGAGRVGLQGRDRPGSRPTSTPTTRRPSGWRRSPG